MTELCCPTCGKPLSKGEKTLRCPKGHCFDIAAQGYVNLLSPHSRVPGDSKEMVDARQRFLATGSYDFMRQRVAEEAGALLKKTKAPVVADAGCGEGYYTAYLAQYLRRQGKNPQVFGFDISKFALKTAGKKDSAVTWAVASLFEMPLPQGCANLVVNIFAPNSGAEFARVAGPEGRLITVTPGAEHLYSLKELLYEKPYKNDTSPVVIPGWIQEKRVEVEGSFTLENNGLIQDLFQMTPYFWKSPKEAKERLNQLESLTTQASFLLSIYHRE